MPKGRAYTLWGCGGQPRVLAEEARSCSLVGRPDDGTVAPVDGAAIFVVDVATGETARVDGTRVERFDDDTLEPNCTWHHRAA